MSKNEAIEKRKKKEKKDPVNILAPLVVLAIIYVGLEIGLRVFNVPSYVMPTPTNIVIETVKSFDIILPDCFLRKRYDIIRRTINGWK